MVMISTMDHAGLHTCPIAQMYGGDCSVAGGFSLAMHHIDGLLSLTEIVFVASVLMLLALLAIGACTLMWSTQRLVQNFSFFEYLILKKVADYSGLPILQVPLRWAALHNKRDLISV